MKLFLFFFIILAALIACSPKNPEISRPTSEEIQKIQPIGKTLSTELLQKLQDTLQQAIQQGGITHAIHICNLKALPLTAERLHSLPFQVNLKRVSARYRNPQNAPTLIENEALKYFEKQFSEAASGRFKPYIQKVKTGGRVHYHYYQPLIVKPLCLSCHGNPDQLDKQLKSQLNNLYPSDRAIGYQEGDFRGVLSVRINAEALK